MKVTAILIAAAVSLPTAAVSADSPVLAGNDLRNAVSGKTVYRGKADIDQPRLTNLDL